jgi:DNA-binding NarL/FixJ family response regulator
VTIRVLIADDQAMMRCGFGMILATQPDIEVVAETGDGVEAIAAMRQLRPDVALLDLRMPRLGGLDALRLLAGPGVADPVRIVIVTAFGDDDYVQAALRNGACGFLLKDSRPALLIEAVRAAVSGDTLISPSIVARLVRRLPSSAPAATPHCVGLSPREVDVVKQVVRGHTNAEIAVELSITVGTVKTHLGSIQGKLLARNRVEIASWAWRTRLVTPGQPG